MRAGGSSQRLCVRAWRAVAPSSSSSPSPWLWTDAGSALDESLGCPNRLALALLQARTLSANGRRWLVGTAGAPEFPEPPPGPTAPANAAGQAEPCGSSRRQHIDPDDCERRGSVLSAQPVSDVVGPGSSGRLHGHGSNSNMSSNDRCAGGGAVSSCAHLHSDSCGRDGTAVGTADRTYGSNGGGGSSVHDQHNSSSNNGGGGSSSPGSSSKNSNRTGEGAASGGGGGAAPSPPAPHAVEEAHVAAGAATHHATAPRAAGPTTPLLPPAPGPGLASEATAAAAADPTTLAAAAAPPPPSLPTAAGSEPANNIWLVRCPTVDMESSYPSLQVFAEAVRQHAASWHPVIISTAMNHALKLKSALSRNRQSYGGGPAAAGRADAAAVGSVDNGSATVVAGSGHENDAPRDDAGALLRATLDQLYSAFLPHVPGIVDARFISNALWVCGRTGHWGAPGGGGGGTLPAALLQRLREDDGSMLERLDGVGHSILWRALSMYSASPKHDKHSPAPATAHAPEDTPPPAAAEPAEPAAQPLAPAPAAGMPVQRPQSESATDRSLGGGGVAARAPAVGGVVDVLQSSAAVLQGRLELGLGLNDDRALQLPEFGNIMRAAARLGYSSDPRFIDSLLRRMVAHPGPFKPPDIADTVHALGKLYGTVRDRECSTAPILDGEGDAGGGCGGIAVSAAASAEPPGPSGGLPPALAPHVRALAGLALRTGLDQFGPPSLSNLVQGLALLGLRLPGVAGQAAQKEAAGRRAAQPPPGGLLSPSHSASPLPSQPPAHPAQLAQADGSERSGPHAGSQAPAEQQLPPGPDAAAGWVVARLGEHIGDRLQKDPSAWTPQLLSNATWALATLGHIDQSYYAAAVHAGLYCGGMDGARKEAWALFLWALARAGHQPPREQLLRQLRAGAAAWSPNHHRRTSDTAALLWALASLDLYDRQVVAGISRIVLHQPNRHQHRQLGGGGSAPSAAAAAAAAVMGDRCHEVAGCLWALAAMPAGALSRHPQLAEALVEAANGLPVGAYSKAALAQLWEAHLELQAAAATANDQRPTVQNDKRPAAEVAPPDTATSEAAVGPAPASSAAPSPRQLSPELVAAARSAVQEGEQQRRRQQRQCVQAATGWRPAVMRCLRGLMNRAAAAQPQQQQQHHQQQQQQEQYQKEEQKQQHQYQLGKKQQQQQQHAEWPPQQQQQQQDAELGPHAQQKQQQPEGQRREWTARGVGAGERRVGGADTATTGGSGGGDPPAESAMTSGRDDRRPGSRGTAGQSRTRAERTEAAGRPDGKSEGARQEGEEGEDLAAAERPLRPPPFAPRVDLMERISRLSERRAASLQRAVLQRLQRQQPQQPQQLQQPQQPDSRGMSSLAGAPPDAQPQPRRGQRQQGRWERQERQGQRQERRGAGRVRAEASAADSHMVSGGGDRWDRGGGWTEREADEHAAAAKSPGPLMRMPVADQSVAAGVGAGPGAAALVPVRILEVEQDWLVEALGVRVGARVRLSDGRQLALELDGRGCFFRNRPRARRPAAALRSRQLARVLGRGGVKHVPYWEWEALSGGDGGSAGPQRAYLSRLLGLS